MQSFQNLWIPTLDLSKNFLLQKNVIERTDQAVLSASVDITSSFTWNSERKTSSFHVTQHIEKPPSSFTWIHVWSWFNRTRIPKETIWIHKKNNFQFSLNDTNKFFTTNWIWMDSYKITFYFVLSDKNKFLTRNPIWIHVKFILKFSKWYNQISYNKLHMNSC